MEGGSDSRPAYSPPSILGKHGRDESSETDPNSTSTPSKLFRCGDCDKSYSRVDHLARHVRLHTQERPYSCEACGKSFARADLLKRHAAGHNNDGNKLPKGAKTTSRQGRVSQACEACAELHLKCENEKPCTRCKAKSIYCQYQSVGASETEAIAHNLLSLSQQPPVSRSPNLFNNSAPTPETQYTAFSIPDKLTSMSSNMPPQLPPTPAPALPTPSSDGYHHHVHFADLPPSHTMDPYAGYNIQDFAQTSAPVTDQTGNRNDDFDGTELRDFLQDVMGMELTAPSSGLKSGTWTPRNIFEFGVDTNLELNDIDFDFLDGYNQHIPFGTGSTPETIGSAVASITSDTPSEPPLAVESLQKSSAWKFRPASRDNQDANLSLPPTDANKRFHVDKRLTLEPLSYNTRDQILAIVYSAGSKTRPIMSFPSPELLDSLLQYFVASTTAMYHIHLPTFNPSHTRPEFTATLIAAGAVLTPDASLRKLGYVMQEALRIQIPQLLERDNSMTRDTQLLQAAVIGLRIGLWSGNSRKMELAESFLQPWTTMIRRAGWFGRKYEIIVPQPEDEGQVLQEKWRKWVEMETHKRLVFFLFRHDAHMSITLSLNPNISYAELSLPLPHSAQLWQAKTAEAWKAAMLKLPHHQLPSVLDLLQNIDRYVESRDLFDVEIATYALLSATWGLVREYRQQMSITAASPNQWCNGTLLLSSRLTELKRLLECLRIGAPDTPSIRVFLETLSMHLHMSLEDVHLFAGVEGHEEAKRVFPSLREWVRTSSARQAVWHAGQITRYAKLIPGLATFNAVAVYHAALGFWSYGVMLAATDTASESKSAEAVVCLNGTDESAAQRFIALNRGRAAITVAKPEGGENIALLGNPGEVMQGLITLMRSSHKVRPPQSRPPLVENLLELMSGLKGV